MAFTEFGSLLSEICSRTPLAPDRPLYWTIIANPKAGGFTIASRWKNHYAQLAERAEKAKKNSPREGGPSKTALETRESSSAHGLIFTRAAGHAGEITDALVKEAAAESSPAKNKRPPFYLVITAGGDGTSLEVQTRLYHAAPEIRENFAVLRLPMGTGNDGSDAWEIGAALDLLIEPAEIKKQRALRLSTMSGKGPFLAFNILSVGLDAFVTHMTNKMKGRLPGDSYKLWVDIAALLYDRIYKVGPMEIRARDDEGNEVKTFTEKVLLLAVGASGRRTYGSHQWILPDERNVCALKQMPLSRKLTLKELFATGTHVDKPEALLWNAAAVDFSARYPLLAQMDGETVRLEPNDFPARIELTEPAIPILKSAGKP